MGCDKSDGSAETPYIAPLYAMKGKIEGFAKSYSVAFVNAFYRNDTRKNLLTVYANNGRDKLKLYIYDNEALSDVAYLIFGSGYFVSNYGDILAFGSKDMTVNGLTVYLSYFDGDMLFSALNGDCSLSGWPEKVSLQFALPRVSLSVADSLFGLLLGRV
jgi:hypothetical protein